MREHSRLVYLSLAAILAGVVVACATILLTAAIDAANAHEKFKWYGWPAAVAIIGAASLVFLVYLVLGIATPLWNLPEIKEGPSYRQAWLQRRKATQEFKVVRQRKLEAALQKTDGVLGFFEDLFARAERDGVYWPRDDYSPQRHSTGWSQPREVLVTHADLADAVDACDTAFAAIERAGEIRQASVEETVAAEHDLGEALAAIEAARASVGHYAVRSA